MLKLIGRATISITRPSSSLLVPRSHHKLARACQHYTEQETSEMASQDLEQMRQHFSKIPPAEQATGWEAMWQKSITPWDRSRPNLALVDALNDRQAVLGTPLHEGKRKRALVPGCGRGYDVVLLASYGYDAVGLDTAASAIRNAKQLQAGEERERKDYPIHDQAVGAGRAEFLAENFFEDGFLSRVGASKFHLIYDYTFLCALPPAMRPQWANRMSQLLAPGGTLICVEFPLGKPLSAGGPPHGLSSDVYTELFKSPGDEISYNDAGDVVSKDDVAQQHPCELRRVAHWQPERSHHVGQGKDMVSLWQHV